MNSPTQSPSVNEWHSYLRSTHRAAVAIAPSKPAGSFDRRQFPSQPLRWIAAAGSRLAKGALALVALALGSLAHTAAAEPMDTWTPVAANATGLAAPNDLIFANGKYWAVDIQGKMEYSSNGLDWTIVQTPTTRTLTSIAYGNGTYVATGYAMTLLSSTNGTTWTIREENAAKSGASFDEVLFANGKFLAISAQPGTAVVRVSTDGITWTSGFMSGAAFYPHDVAWGNGLYVVVGSVDGNNSVQTSTDGLTWTRRNAGITSLEYVTYFNNRFVAVGTTNAPVVATSLDGITWTKAVTPPLAPADLEFWGIEVLNGRVFAFGDNGLLLSSTNGINWVKHTTGTTNSITEAVYNGTSLYLMRRSETVNGVAPLISAAWSPAGTPIPDTPPPVETGDPTAARIVNLSSRAWVGTGDAQFIAGFVIKGTTPKKVLIRTVGPTLANFNVTGFLADPQLRVVSSTGAEIATNNDWGTNANAAAIVSASTTVGAFALPAGSKDAASLVTLQPGAYSIVMSGTNNSTGIALVEVYDVDAPGACKLVNIASRALVGTGDQVAIAGFVVSGSAPRKLLIRGIGPTLSSLGVAGAIADPRITLFTSNQTKLAENDNWGSATNVAALQTAATQVGAFALASGTADAAMLVTVNPGAYSVVVSGANATMTGIGMVEVYEVP